MGLVILIPFCLTYAIGRKKGIGGGRENQNEASRENRSEAGHEASREEGKDSASQPIRELKAYVSGEVIPMEDVPDQVFASRALGDGVAIKPEDGVLRAPADAMVAAVMEESLHAHVTGSWITAWNRCTHRAGHRGDAVEIWFQGLFVGSLGQESEAGEEPICI
ncbi:MAG: PTS glucose transporter subunit IIA [Enterocloster bolteae]